jgi:predicted permease
MTLVSDFWQDLRYSLRTLVCIVLLIAAGLLTRGLQSAQTVDPGFSMKGVVATYFDLAQQAYDNAHALQFHRQLIERVSTIPGVDATSQAVTVPLGGSSYGTVIEVEGVPNPQQIRFNQVSPAFFSLLGIPIVQGRVFKETESRTALISEGTARRFWPHQNPLGKIFRMGKEKTPYEVIGVARDIRASNLASFDKTFLYFPPNIENQVSQNLLVHTRGNQAAAVKLIREAAHSLDANIIVVAKPLEERLEVWQLPSRILASLTGALGLLGLLLASLGIYGVVSYAVSSRVREIGIRMTLGARPAEILSLILKQAMRPVFVGVLIGFAACAAATRLMSVMLYGVSPFDPVTFGGVGIFLTGIALLACYVPARRATRVDPMVALRYE